LETSQHATEVQAQQHVDHVAPVQVEDDVNLSDEEAIKDQKQSPKKAAQEQVKVVSARFRV
jgi:hypothetical protein